MNRWVFAPPSQEVVYHTDGVTAYYNGQPLSPPKPVIDPNAIFMVNETGYLSFRIDYPGKLFSLGSAAAHLCYVARGFAVGNMEDTVILDYTASAAILRVLGIPFRYLSGSEVDFTDLYDGRSVPEPTLVCLPQHFDVLQRAITKIG